MVPHDPLVVPYGSQWGLRVPYGPPNGTIWTTKFANGDTPWGLIPRRSAHPNVCPMRFLPSLSYSGIEASRFRAGPRSNPIVLFSSGTIAFRFRQSRGGFVPSLFRLGIGFLLCAGGPLYRTMSSLFSSCIYPVRFLSIAVQMPIIAAPFRYGALSARNLPRSCPLRLCSILVPKPFVSLPATCRILSSLFSPGANAVRCRCDPVWVRSAAAQSRHRFLWVPDFPCIEHFRRCSVLVSGPLGTEPSRHRFLPPLFNSDIEACLLRACPISKPTAAAQCRKQCLPVSTRPGMGSFRRCSATASTLPSASSPRHRTSASPVNSGRYPFRPRSNPVSIPIVAVQFRYLARSAPNLPNICALRRCSILVQKPFVPEPAPC